MSSGKVRGKTVLGGSIDDYAPFYNKWLAVDLDGTILEMSPSLEVLGPVKYGAGAALKTFREMGYKICIHTARPSHQHHDILMHLESYGVPFDEINADLGPFRCTKPLADLYIDDRAFHLTDWISDLPLIIERLSSQTERN